MKFISYFGNNIGTKSRLLLFIAFTAGLLYTMRNSPPAAEWYMTHVYTLIAGLMSNFSALFPFSISDVFYIILIAGALILFILICIRKIRLLKGLYILLLSITIGVLAFYMLWGFAYFRKDFYSRTGIPEIRLDSLTFADFAEEFLKQANEACSKDLSISREQADAETETQYNKLKDLLKISYPNGKRRPKQMLFEALFSKALIAGYFGILNEVHVNGIAADLEYPYELAHEKAHQFGIADEAECNVYAFIVCSTSNNPAVRYSAWLMTYGYVLKDYRRFYPDKAKDFVTHTNPQIINDINSIHKLWRSVKNEKVQQIHEKTYDTYLKANKIPSGIANYSEMVALLASVMNYYNKIK
jgi:energy-coupling factor transporter transmembrane protein EcfT